MSVGTLASGVLAYAFNVLAARALGPAAYGAIGALWGAMFLLAVLLFRPIEQTVSRAVADHVARGEDGRPAVRSAAWLTALITTAAVAGCVLAWAPITDRLFGGEPVLTVALIAGLAGYGLSYFARGLVGGVQWFGGYGLVLLADGAIRFVLALPLLIVASQTVAAVAIAAAAAGGAVAPLLSRRRGKLRRLRGARKRGEFALGSAVALRAARRRDRRRRAGAGERRPAARADRRRRGRRGGGRRAVRRHAARARARVPAPGRPGLAAAEPDHVPRPRRRGLAAPRDGQGRRHPRRLRGACWPPARWSPARSPWS